MAESVILDPATLQAFRNSLGADGADVFRTVLRLFLSDAPRLIAAMEKGLRETDLRLVQRSAHTLRTNCSTIGALELAHRCQTLEASCRQGDRSHWPEQGAAITELFPAVLSAVQAELERSLPDGGV